MKTLNASQIRDQCCKYLMHCSGFRRQWNQRICLTAAYTLDRKACVHEALPAGIGTSGTESRQPLQSALPGNPTTATARASSARAYSTITPLTWNSFQQNKVYSILSFLSHKGDSLVTTCIDSTVDRDEITMVHAKYLTFSCFMFCFLSTSSTL